MLILLAIWCAQLLHPCKAAPHGALKCCTGVCLATAHRVPSLQLIAKRQHRSRPYLRLHMVSHAELLHRVPHKGRYYLRRRHVCGLQSSFMFVRQLKLLQCPTQLGSDALYLQRCQAFATVGHPLLQVVPASSAAAGGRADGASSPVQPADACSHAPLQSSKLRLAGGVGAKKEGSLSTGQPGRVAKEGSLSTGQPGRVAEVAAGPDTPSRSSEELSLSVSRHALSGPTLHWQARVPSE